MTSDPTKSAPPSRPLARALPDELEAFEALEAELPALEKLNHFTGQADRISWFGRLGDPLDQETTALARHYLDALGFPDTDIAQLLSWKDAEAAAQSLDWDTAAWEAEEQLRAGLTTEALECLSEEALGLALTDLTSRLQATLRNAVEEAASLSDETDEALLTAAAGAGLQAAYSAALSIAADAGPDHPCWLKYRLFAAGRWPVGLAGLSFNLF